MTADARTTAESRETAGAANLPQVIATTNLELAAMSPAFLSASLDGRFDVAASELGATPAPEWPDDRDVVELWLRRSRDPESIVWGPYAVLLRAERRMIGHAGFHLPPGAPGLEPYARGGVELGYTIYPDFRRRGFATEACVGLMDWAAAHGVTSFVVSISPTNAASIAVARRLGFGDRVGSHVDADDGVEDIYVLHRR